MRALVPLLGLLAAGCATLKPPAPAPEAEGGAWALQASATAGSALVRTDAAGGEQLRIACRRNPPDLFVATGQLRNTGAIVLLRAGRTTVPLTPAAEAEGLAATGPLSDTLPAALMGGGEISVTQAGRRLGPYPAPDEKTAAAFAIACRGSVR